MNLLVIGGHERMEKDYMVMAKKKVIRQRYILLCHLN